MSFLKKAELINVVIEEIVYAAPSNWEKLVYYTERLQDKEIGLRSVDTAKCWIGKEMRPYDNSKGGPLKSTMELFDAVDRLFEDAEENGQPWSGLSLTLNNDGKYSSKFYYEGTPLLDGNYEELAKRF